MRLKKDRSLGELSQGLLLRDLSSRKKGSLKGLFPSPKTRGSSHRSSPMTSFGRGLSLGKRRMDGGGLSLGPSPEGFPKRPLYLRIPRRRE